MVGVPRVVSPRRKLVDQQTAVARDGYLQHGEQADNVETFQDASGQFFRLTRQIGRQGGGREEITSKMW